MDQWTDTAVGWDARLKAALKNMGLEEARLKLAQGYWKRGQKEFVDAWIKNEEFRLNKPDEMFTRRTLRAAEWGAVAALIAAVFAALAYGFPRGSEGTINSVQGEHDKHVSGESQRAEPPSHPNPNWTSPTSKSADPPCAPINGCVQSIPDKSMSYGSPASGGSSLSGESTNDK